jgi:hypothetical protein
VVRNVGSTRHGGTCLQSQLLKRKRQFKSSLGKISERVSPKKNTNRRTGVMTQVAEHLSSSGFNPYTTAQIQTSEFVDLRPCFLVT